MRALLFAVIFAIGITLSFEALSRSSEATTGDSEASGCRGQDSTTSSYLQALSDPVIETAEDTAVQSSCTDSGDFLGLSSGWYQNREVRYYDFGDNTKLTQSDAVEMAPIYAFITGFDAEGNPLFIDGQHTVVDIRPGDIGYSDLWQVIFVTVPENYEPDSIRSAEGVISSGFELTRTDLLVNCPIVPQNTELEGGEPLIQAWYKNEQVFYFDFGPNAAATIPVFEFTTGPDYYGNRQPGDGQMPIFGSPQEDRSYSAFAQVYLVTVPGDYLPNSIRSADEVWSSGYKVTSTDVIINAPILELLQDSGR